jgi:antitoxin component YwqK of YwqJK toxin-antitoxin module
MRKKIHIILLIFLIVGCKPNKLSTSEVENKSGRYFYKGTPFTGVIFDVNSDNIMTLEFHVEDGKRVGPYKQWGRSGKKLIELNLVNYYTIEGRFAYYYEIDRLKTKDNQEVINIEGTVINNKLVDEFNYNGRTLYGDLLLQKYTLDKESNVISWQQTSDQQGILQGRYKNGVKELFYNNGQIKSKIKYSNWHLNFNITGNLGFSYNDNMGKIIGEYSTYYENGNLNEKGTYNNGLKIGNWITYHENGQIKKKESYNENGKLNGPFEYFFEDGQTFQKGNYHNGSLDGWWEQHYRGGVPREIEYKTLYKDGVVIDYTEQY